MNLNKLQKNWDQFGRIDPLWAIETWPDKKGNKWQADEFFRTGKTEIEEVIKYVGSLGTDIQRRKALDFGCGVGRVTQALACYFNEVCGVDIAPSMLELANRYNRHGNKCKYYLNETDNLRLFNDCSFDLVYSNITLQHMNPRYARNYIKEFIRILVPHGLILFQLPSEVPSERMLRHCGSSERLRQIARRRNYNPGRRLKEMAITMIPRALAEAYREQIVRRPIMETYCIKREELVSFLKNNGAKIIDIFQLQSPPQWVSLRYCITKESFHARIGAR